MCLRNDGRLFFSPLEPHSYFLELSVKSLSLIMTNLVPKEVGAYFYLPRRIWSQSQKEKVFLLP